VQIEFEIFGDRLIKRRILRVGLRGRNMAPAFFVMSKYFYAMEKRLFETEGASGLGQKWGALKEETSKAKARMSLRPEILRATDVLRKSLTQPNAKFSRRKITFGEMFVGTTDPKAKHHYWGAPRANVPMRRPVVFREVDKVMWVKMAQEYLITGEIAERLPVFI